MQIKLIKQSYQKKVDKYTIEVLLLYILIVSSLIFIPISISYFQQTNINT